MKTTAGKAMKSRNHFVLSYTGNKRKEVEHIYSQINFKGIKTIVEPFCGSSAFAYYVATQQPGKFKYILNDGDPYLIELYNILRDDKRTQELQDEINATRDPAMTKPEWNDIVRSGSLVGWFIARKYYNIRIGLYPMMKNNMDKPVDLVNHPFRDFLKREEITILCQDAIDLYKKLKTKKNHLLFLDPPYMELSNSQYESGADFHIYEHLSNNNITKEKANVVLCLEDMWVIRLLFKDIIHTAITYDKKYDIGRKKRTQHIVINNRKDT